MFSLPTIDEVVLNLSNLMTEEKSVLASSDGGVQSFSFMLSESQWLCNGWSFSTGENRENFHIHIFSGRHGAAHPQNAVGYTAVDITQTRLAGILQDARQ